MAVSEPYFFLFFFLSFLLPATRDVKESSTPISATGSKVIKDVVAVENIQMLLPGIEPRVVTFTSKLSFSLQPRGMDVR
jgi:hypothetical protein